MAWTPKFDAQFIEPLIDSLITVIKRDEFDALNWANGGADLPVFAMHQRARRVEMKYPFLAVLAVQSKIDQSEDDGKLTEHHEIVIEVALTGTDPNALSGLLFKYVRALDSIIRNMSFADLTAGMTNDGHGKVSWEVTDHSYTLARRLTNSQYLQVGQLKAVFDYSEV